MVKDNPSQSLGSAEETPTSSRDQFQVRHRFVGLLFALAMTEVARQGVRLWEPVAVWSWAAPTHLFLCAMLIATSWVGWSNSIQLKQRLCEVFDLQFLELLLDILLVFIYFVIVARVEITTGTSAVEVPSATPEAWGLVVVFVVYALWDVCTDVVRSRQKFVQALGVHAFASVLCFLLSYLCLWRCKEVMSVFAVVAVDVSLIAIVFVFRALKRLERPIARKLGWPDNETANLRFPRDRDRGALVICLIAFAVGLIAAK